MRVLKCVLLVQTELLVELSNAAAGIDQLLLASEEGVTLRAHFYLDVFLGRTCLNHITAGASNSSLLIIGMDSFLHCSCSPLSDPKLAFSQKLCYGNTLFLKMQELFSLFYIFTNSFVAKKYKTFSRTGFSVIFSSASAYASSCGR